jgi:hypothetical protein
MLFFMAEPGSGPGSPHFAWSRIWTGFVKISGGLNMYVAWMFLILGWILILTSFVFPEMAQVAKVHGSVYFTVAAMAALAS